MAKNALFRNSLSGYNKDDVQRYIDDLNVQFTDREDELEAQIKALKKELEVLPELIAAKERADELSQQAELLRKENSDLADAIKAQGSELLAKNEELSKTKAEKEALEMRLLELGEKEKQLMSESTNLRALYDAKTSELEAKTKQTETMKKEFEEEKAQFEKRAEDMLCEIQNQAKYVIEKANETAELIIANAKKKADTQVSKQSFAEYGTSPSYDKKKDNLSDMLDSHKSKMDSFFSSIVKAFRGDGK